MRIAWIIVGLCAATLAVAQKARPPDAPPALAGPGFEFPDYEAMKNEPPWPPTELPRDTRAAYDAAVSDGGCPGATDALIESMSPIIRVISHCGSHPVLTCKPGGRMLA